MLVSYADGGIWDFWLCLCLYILHILAVCVHNTSRTFLPLHRPIILVLSVVNITQNCNFGITINRGIKFRRTSKNCEFRPILVYILETIQDRAIVPYFILGSGLISSLQAQAAEWAHMPSPSSQGLTLCQDTVRTESEGADHTHACACSW